MTAAVVVAGMGILALVVMLRIAADAPDAERAKLQIEALKYGLGFFAAAGAVAALLLAVRRQLLAEHTHDLAVKAQMHTEVDAAERRVTDLYTKAAEQLGSADAAVRLAGLYALERVAQNNPAQRQTIVNVLCAYLRMPYGAPAPARPAPAAAVTELSLQRPASTTSRDPQQELQVRLTAQRILIAHLTLPPETTPEEAGALTAAAEQPFWPTIDLDLTGAHLVDWSLPRSHVRQATFARAIFDGDAVFGWTTFTGGARFDGAAFVGGAGFEGAAFAGGARFDGATFTGSAEFDWATFAGDAGFGAVTFEGHAAFGRATFAGDALFGEVTFAGSAGFVGATFTGSAAFIKATFARDATFSGATFNGRARFDEVAFTGGAWFVEATFTASAMFIAATFTDDVRFDEATFTQITMERAQVVRRENRKDWWPPGWRLRSDSSISVDQLVAKAPSADAPS
jgi:uncharacterized protein YjbI with pentapeptide repeats